MTTGTLGLTVEDLKDKRRAWRTANLFEETCEDPVKYPPIYTFQDAHGALPSLKRNYLDLGDQTEYAFANLYLGGWNHWQLICKSWACKPYIEEMRNELKLKLEAESLAKIRELSEGTGPQALNAAKYLHDLNRGAPRKRGRPSQAEKDAALKAELRDSEDVAADAARLGLKVVK